MEDAHLDDWIEKASSEGLDAEQIELGSSSTFWTLMSERREQPTISRTELEQALAAHEQPR